MMLVLLFKTKSVGNGIKRYLTLAVLYVKLGAVYHWQIGASADRIRRESDITRLWLLSASPTSKYFRRLLWCSGSSGFTIGIEQSHPFFVDMPH